MTGRRWWHDAFGYEIYLRSFADGNGDGIGDLPGLLQRLDHLAWLGVDLCWISPFYVSPHRDHGYDVADYTDVDPTYGTVRDAEAVIDRAHELGMRVIVDLVPNHTSSDHPWFVEARSSRDSPYRDYYIWRDPGPGGGPPNNWASHFGGPAWTYDEHTGQYWLHLFDWSQPDLNWANPAVADAFDDVLRCWLDRGADGFRIDVAHALVKHPDLPDLPSKGGENPADMPLVEGTMLEHDLLEHVYDADQPEVLDVYRRWRAIAEEHDAVLLGEVYLLDGDRVHRYVAADDGLHLAFWFGLMHIDWDPDALRQRLEEGLTIAPGHVAWAQGSHDRPRPPTRWGGGDLGRRRALALATLFVGLPGVPFLFQGEELGLTDGELTQADAQDPIARHAGDVARGRDGCRTPMPWEPGPGFGFTAAEAAWLPFGGRTPEDTVAVQREDPASWLHRYRALIGARRTYADLRHGALRWATADGPVIAYERGGVFVAANCGEGDASTTLPLGVWQVVFATTPGREQTTVDGQVDLAETEALVCVRASS